MEKRIISIDISPETENEYYEKAGIMWEHNATQLQFNISPLYIGDYRYYIEYRSILGTKVRTEYLEVNTENNTITYDIPVTMSSLKGVECYFNIVEIDGDGNTVQVVKPKKFGLTFDFSPDTDNSLAKVNDFSINALLEAIRTGTFKGERGEKGVKGDRGDRGEQGDGVNNLFDASVNLYNEKTNTDGYAVSSAGVLIEMTGYTTTDFIRLKKGQYTMNYDSSHRFASISRYNLDMEFIKRDDVLSGSFEITEECYVRLSGYKHLLPENSVMIVKGTELPTEYVPYFLKLKSKYLPEIEANTDDMIISKEDTDFVKASGNLINHMTITSGKIMSTAGVLTDNAQYCITDKMRLKRSTVYTARKLTRISYFKEDGTHIVTKSIENASYTPITFTTNAEFDYAIISLAKNKIVKDEWQLYEGDTVPEKFEKQHLVIDGYRIYDEPDVAVDPIVEFKEKDRIIFDKSPLFTLDEEVDGIDVATQRNSASVFAMYDTLMSENPLYITKTELGADSQGKKLYRYDFKNPDVLKGGTGDASTKKTKIILVSGIHNEYAGIYSLFHAMKQITTNPELTDLKNNVHFIVVPVVNVYGVDNNTRANENGINMARNFEVGFSANTGSETLGFSGVEAFTENGCIYIDNIMQENSDAILFVSCHNFAKSGDNAPNSFMWAYCETKYYCNIADKVISKLSKAWGEKYDCIPFENAYVSGNGDSKYIGFSELAPRLGTEANQALKYGIQSGVFEVCDYFHFKSSTEMDTSFVLSRGAETYINLILAHLYNYDANF